MDNELGESVQQILDMEARRPHLIQRLLEGRNTNKAATDEAITKLKATAAEQDDAIVRSLRALGWRRSRTPKAETGAEPKPKRKRTKKQAA